MPPPTKNTAIEEFFLWESQTQVEVFVDLDTNEKATFVPLADIRTYFGANDARNLTKILQEVFRTKDLPIEPDLILQEHSAVFCILLRVGQGWLIEEFAYYEELSDRRLPFDSSHPQQEFPMIDEDPSLLERFCEKQWMYCVPTFDSHMLHKRFGKQRLLPIIDQELSTTDGQATKRVVELYGPHNKLLNIAGKNDIPDTNKFVLKTYSRKDSEGIYKKETNGFRSLKNADSIIQFYGSYIHGDSMNIILEYADKGSLEDFFRNESAPSRGIDIIKFWESMFQLIKGLKAIHSVREGHCGINPDTILVVSNGAISSSDWRFKFADFGLNTKQGGGDSITYQHLPAYSAPKSHSPYDYDDEKEDAASWEDDIWSLGCIYSEAAIWISDGYTGLNDYRKNRVADTVEPLFHDGERVLQGVLDAHRDIEDRLRRSDHITKDVLDSMVDEMLWEEDRPNSKALSRKAEVIISRSRQRLSANSSKEHPRPKRALPPPRLPPSQPLPPIPRGQASSLSSIAERYSPSPNVDNWRSQITIPQTTSQLNLGQSQDQSPVVPNRRMSITTSGSDIDRERSGSSIGWQNGDSGSIASPISPFTSPHTSVHYDYHKHHPNEGKPRTLQSHDERRAPTAPSQAIAYELADEQATFKSSTPTVPPRDHRRGPSSASSQQHHTEDYKRLGRTSSRASSNNSSSTYSTETKSPKTQKRFGGFSLFPTRSGTVHTNSSQNDDDRQPPGELIAHQSASPTTDYLSLNTCLEWKKAHKKVKKASRVPPLPGANIIESLRGRDHVFIVDDSKTMANVWPEVKRVFEALSYIVKGMSPNGTELFYTISYDTYLRKDTSDLCTFLETKELAGETNISYRLDLQLQNYEVKLLEASRAKGKKPVVRPMSFYVLTNGEWGEGINPKITIQKTVDFLIEQKVRDGQLTLQFITFAQSARAMQKFSELSRENFGIDMVDCTPWRGNVLKMLRGPLDKSLYANDSGDL